MVTLFYLGPQYTENLLDVEERDEISDDVPISTNNTAALSASSKKNYEPS